MQTIPLEEAQANLPELIDHLQPGEEVLIVRGEKPVAKLVGETSSERIQREPGKGKGHILYMAEDFDSPLEDFKEYME
ncbi:MAG: type II toxin-antitoxin system Phd/YefM family antitoxin [Thermoguttaceae bacterium]|jgi:antitoxin (DNA-binding transcriptional repressor) of toxin-antitoxin stability system